MMLSSRSRCRARCRCMKSVRMRDGVHCAAVVRGAGQPSARTRHRDEAKVQKRLETAKGELAQQDKFDYVVVNDTVERAVNELHEILNKRR